MTEDATVFVSRRGAPNPSDPERSPPRRVSGWGTTVRGLARWAALLWQNS